MADTSAIVQLELDNEQKMTILRMWSESSTPPSIIDLIKAVFPDIKNPDARTKEGVLIKKYLISQKLNVVPNTYQKKGLIELTLEQQEYVRNNCANMKAFEMARELFDNKNLSPVSQESRSIYAFIKTLNKEVFQPTDTKQSFEYSPPKTLDRICAKINRYVKDSNLDFANLKVTEKRQALALIGYLHNFRFIHQINSYGDDADKSLFESAFVDYTWNKDDLSSEDIDQYIMLCNEKIMAVSIQRNINQLQQEQERIISEDGKMSMTLVEAIKSSRTEHNDCIKRQQNLYKTLTQERSDRLSQRRKETPSLLNLIALWKEEESRKDVIRLAEERNIKLSEEIDRLANMDDLKIKLIGLSKEEILYG